MRYRRPRAVAFSLGSCLRRRRIAHVNLPAVTQTCSPTSLSDSVLAGAGRAAAVGRLSVPPNWTSANPAATPTAEPAAAAETAFRALPSWALNQRPEHRAADDSRDAAQQRSVPNEGRRYRIPRPPSGG